MDLCSELDTVLAAVAQIRHDVNNPLSAAMTETELQLMDVTEPEGRSGLESILYELGRIRDRVRELDRLHQPNT